MPAISTAYTTWREEIEMAMLEPIPHGARIPESVEGPGCDQANAPRLWRKRKKATRWRGLLGR